MEVHASDAWFGQEFSRPSVGEMAFSASPVSEDAICTDRKSAPAVSGKEQHAHFKKELCSLPGSFSQIIYLAITMWQAYSRPYRYRDEYIRAFLKLPVNG